MGALSRYSIRFSAPNTLRLICSTTRVSLWSITLGEHKALCNGSCRHWRFGVSQHIVDQVPALSRPEPVASSAHILGVDGFGIWRATSEGSSISANTTCSSANVPLPSSDYEIRSTLTEKAALLVSVPAAHLGSKRSKQAHCCTRCSVSHTLRHSAGLLPIDIPLSHGPVHGQRPDASEYPRNQLSNSRHSRSQHALPAPHARHANR